MSAIILVWSFLHIRYNYVQKIKPTFLGNKNIFLLSTFLGYQNLYVNFGKQNDFLIISSASSAHQPYHVFKKRAITSILIITLYLRMRCKIWGFSQISWIWILFGGTLQFFIFSIFRDVEGWRKQAQWFPSWSHEGQN